MNAIAGFVTREWDRLDAAPGPRPAHVSCFLKTPRFRASAHVLLFLFCDGADEPRFVAKVPRLVNDSEYLDREVANLRCLQSARAGGFGSAPRVVAYERLSDTPLLLETVVPGEIMSPAFVRARTELCLEAGCTWLVDLHRSTEVSSVAPFSWDEIVAPLDRLEELFRPGDSEYELTQRTREMVEPLRSRELRAVFEHGDFSSPNLLVDSRGRLGVVDWELARDRGLPTADFSFFLTYVAFARHGADDRSSCVRAFDAAFFGRNAWAASWLARFARETRLPEGAMTALFVLGWARYVEQTVSRLGGEQCWHAPGADDLRRWLRESRFLALWEHTVHSQERLNPTDAVEPS